MPLLRTKLHRPTVVGSLVCRKRLHERMDVGLEEPLTLVSAPAGYGKNMLVSHWAESLELPRAWVSLDESDSEVQVFLSYFLAAVNKLFPAACPEARALLGAPNFPSLTSLAGTLSNELDAIETPFVLMLDDYHRIVPASQVHDLLRLLLEHPPEPLHLVLLTRRDPPLPIASMRASRHIVEVRLQDLRFTDRETADFLAATDGFEISDKALANLQRQTEGWAVGLCLVSQYLRHHDDPEGFLKSLSSSLQLTQQYLVQEVLAGRSPRMQDWLLKTSILGRFCPSLCDAVCATGAASGEDDLDGHHFIEALLRVNLFTISLDSRGEWFRYHHLFQESLDEELRRRTSPEEIATLNLQASEWFEAHGLMTESIEHALKAGDVERSMAIIEEHRHDEIAADRWHVVESWLRMIPGEVKQDRPAMLLAEATIAHVRFHLERIPSLVGRAEQLLANSSSESHLQGELNYFEGLFLYWQGEAQASLPYLEKALPLISEKLVNIRSNVELMLALARHMVDQEGAAIRALDEEIVAADPSEEYFLSYLLASRIFLHILSGDLTQARIQT